MKKRYCFRLFLLFILLVCGETGLLSQPLIFKQTYDVPPDNFYTVRHSTTLDGGVIMVTNSRNITNLSYYITVIKTNGSGMIEWSRRFISAYSSISEILQLPDSSYIFTTVDQSVAYFFLVFRLDQTGNTIFTKSFYVPMGSMIAGAPQCIAKPGGGVYVVSDLHNMQQGHVSWLLFEVTLSGNLAWSRIYNDGFLKCRHNNATLCANGDLLLTGYILDTVSQKCGPVITRVDSLGNLLWTNYYLNSGITVTPAAIFELSNGNIALIAGSIYPSALPNETVYLQTDSGGNILRTMAYTNFVHGMPPGKSALVENNNIVITGNSDSGSFCMKVDSLCGMLYCRQYLGILPQDIHMIAGPGYSFSGVHAGSAHACLFTTDTTLSSCFNSLFAVDTLSYSFAVTSLFITDTVFMTDSTFLPIDTIQPVTSLKLCDDVGITEPVHKPDISIYPVPASGTLFIECDEQLDRVCISDIIGKVVFEGEDYSSHCALDISALANGMYVLQTTSASGVGTSKIIVNTPGN